MKLTLCALGAALAVTGVSLAARNAPPITAKVLGAATFADPYTVSAPRGAATVVQSITVPPRASFGWHKHGSAIAVVVTSGTITLYDASRAGCGPRRVSAGQGFLEQKGHVHLARNETTKPVKIYAVALGLTKTAKPTIPAAEPAGCSVQ